MSQTEASAQSEASASGSAAGKVTLTLSDIEAGLSALPRAKLARGVSYGGAVAVIALVAYRWIEGRDRTSLAIIAALLLGLLFANRNPAKRIAKRVFASLPDDARAIRVTVDEEGFHIHSSGQESRLQWVDVHRCVETREVLLVFVSRNDAQILPKRAFTEAELDSVREWSKTKIVKHDEPFTLPQLTPALRTRMLIWLVVFALVWTAFTVFSRR
jgi:hypothetical protein